MDTLISNVTAVTMNEQMQVLFGAYIGITDGKIVSITTTAPQEQPKTIVDGTGMVAIPGLVNCHTHLSETVLRNSLDELSKRETLEKQLQMKSRMDLRSAEASAKLGIAECLRFGVTAVSDLGEFPEAVARAVAQTGIRGNVAMACCRFEDAGEDYDFASDPQGIRLRELVDTWHGFDNGRIRIDAGIYAEYTSNYPLWEALGDFAAQEGLGMQLHLAQTGQEEDDCLERSGLHQAELLHCHRLLQVSACAAGCGYLTGEEQALLARQKASGVVLPAAAARAGEAGTDIAACVKAGMNIAMGSDGPVEGGNADLFECMRLAVYQSGRSGGQPLPAQAALMLATVCGARAQGRQDTCGMLKVGMAADIVLVDFTAPHLMPCHHVLSGLVFSARGGDVAMTMVNGKILYQSGRFPTLDLTEVVAELSGYAIPRLFRQPEEA